MGGDRPVGLAVGIVATAVLVLLPALLVPTFYLFANVYALITGEDFSSDTMNIAVFLTGLVLSVSVFVVLMGVAIALVGKGLTPRKRAKT
jgi:cell division protein FtsX